MFAVIGKYPISGLDPSSVWPVEAEALSCGKLSRNWLCSLCPSWKGGP